MNMDTDKLSQRIRKRFDHNQAKRVLREKYQAKMLFAYNGGMWCAGPDLIVLCNCNTSPECVFEDTHGNPIKVNVSELKKLTLERWHEQMNAWHAEYESLKRER